MHASGIYLRFRFAQGDVLSGTSSSGKHRHGVIEGWFGENRWNGRFAILSITTVGVFAPLTCFEHIGKPLHVPCAAQRCCNKLVSSSLNILLAV
jgi:hypothetical protein